ncbi:MAG TPA: D-alanyl-D-alanine carboxypeptidase/D-alanyl-D-alanine-endopeptidase [bacterium]|nr:D-alanyl-D-alanine carboxypeptidase/D-alanyl-D-alanine-endopeptidase [bacterium]
MSFTNRIFTSVSICVFVFTAIGVHADEAVITSAEAVLDKEIRTILNARVCREGNVGVVVENLEDGRVVFEYNPDLPLKPASNQKILTTIGALGLLSPQYQFKTRVFRASDETNGVLGGDLYIKGGGDPFLVKEEMWLLADRVAAMGIRHVKGNIIADGSFFDSVGEPSPDWERIRMPLWYNAPTGGLAFNFNAITVIASPGAQPGDPVKISVDPPLECFQIEGQPTTGPPGSRITLILDIRETEGICHLLLKGRMPSTCGTQSYYRHINSADMYAGHAFKYYLEQVGVIVDGTVIRGETPESASEIVVHESEPLYGLLQAANKYSNNFMIEQIVKTIAAETVSNPGSTAEGLEKIKSYFTDIGMDTSGMVLNDGSGLSRSNLVSARQLARLIEYAVNESHYGPEFLTTLPVAGVDGTLKKRLKDHPDKRLVRAKTGLINNVVCLSGLVDGRRGKGLVFSILINRNHSRHRDSKEVQDEIVEALLTYWKTINTTGIREGSIGTENAQ